MKPNACTTQPEIYYALYLGIKHFHLRSNLLIFVVRNIGGVTYHKNAAKIKSVSCNEVLPNRI